MTEETNIVPIFRNISELQADEAAIAAELEREWNDANDAYDAAMTKVAELKRDPPGEINEGYTRAVSALKRLANLEPSSALACNRMIQVLAGVEKRRIDLGAKVAIERAELDALTKLIAARRATIERRDERLFGLGAVAKRSRRFAMAAERKYYGPAATVTTIGAGAK